MAPARPGAGLGESVDRIPGSVLTLEALAPAHHVAARGSDTGLASFGRDPARRSGSVNFFAGTTRMFVPLTPDLQTGFAPTIEPPIVVIAHAWSADRRPARRARNVI
jgi:hypothetical protein